jgi:hypothetical protein
MCSQGCGFFGNQSTGGMCSKCYKDSQPQPVNIATTSDPVVEETPDMDLDTPEVPIGTNAVMVGTSSVVEEVPSRISETTPGLTTGTTVDDTDMKVSSSEEIANVKVEVIETADEEKDEEKKPDKKVQKNKKRCFECNKKVGFTGVECKCGFIFCGTHRYPELHACDFDFKSHDRANLAARVQGGGKFSKIDKV